MKGKTVFYWLGISLLFISELQATPPANEAATTVAEKIYWVGNNYLATQEWAKAVASFESALLLKPEWEVLRLKKKKWEDFSKKEGEEKYRAKEKIVRDRSKEKMNVVRKVLEEGDKAEALFVLKEVVQTDAGNERAKTFLLQLEKQAKGAPESEGFSEEIRKRFQKALQLFEEGKKTKNYPKLREAAALFGAEDLKPSFYGALLSEKNKVGEALHAAILPTLARWEKEITQSPADLKIIGFKLQKIEKEYPPLTEIDDLLKKIYSALEKRAKTFFLQAKTTQELEGCKKAVDKFVRVKEIAIFSEVPVWQEAEKNIEACRGKI